MKKRMIGSVIAAAVLATGVHADDSLMQRFEKMEKELAALKAELETLKTENTKLSTQLSTPAATEKKTEVASASKLNETLDDLQDQISEINKKTNKNNLKWDVDFRTSVDNLHYKMADGSTQENDAVLSNRLWLNMSYAATKNLSFVGQLAYNKIFGQRSMSPDPLAADGFDWVSGESAYDDTLRVRSAYFFYTDDELAGLDIPWTFSIGRRPSTEGHLINYRDDVSASSPLAHTVNVEFDGASAKFGTEELTGLDGSYFKLCFGRGMSDAEPRFNPAPYVSSDAKTTNIDMAGIILVPYDDKQYSVGMQYTYANNLIDITDNGMTTNTVPPVLMSGTPDYNFETVGGLHTATAFAMVHGIGDGISDFLDDSMIFVSGAMTKTDPKAGKTMLGSADSETGYSYWIGTQFPSLISDEGRWGIEFNHGSKYWRPITYGEDTMIGSKIAARGDAYEVYFTEPLVDDILTFQLRYTYIDYDYSGSNGFFGSASGTPMAIEDVPAMMQGSVVDKAQDIRAYIRYRF
jgi:cell division protein FtsB